MGKQELIEELECLEVSTNSLDYLKGADYANERAINLAKQLDEPKKVEFTDSEKFVVDWIEHVRKHLLYNDICFSKDTGSSFMMLIGAELGRYTSGRDSLINKDIANWITNVENQIRLANAIDFGYEINLKPVVHDLKIKPEYFEAVVSGEKRFEIRKNDRDFKKGDTIRLREYQNGEYTGDIYVAKITYITDFAQKDGYVVLGISDSELSRILGDE
ncbi:DUF3850 domain-containing protein [Enterococcus faecalis]|nr:DUF3850 domain-containing protein [Enterococcus faecalis]